MEHDRPLFELIMEESRRACRPDDADAAIADRLKQKKHRRKWLFSARWLLRKRDRSSRARAALILPPFAFLSSPSPSPAAAGPALQNAQFTSTLDAFCLQNCHGNVLDEQAGGFSLPCLQDDGQKYLEAAAILDMLDLCAVKACARRGTAISQVSNICTSGDALHSSLWQQVNSMSRKQATTILPREQDPHLRQNIAMDFGNLPSIAALPELLIARNHDGGLKNHTSLDSQTLPIVC